MSARAHFVSGFGRGRDERLAQILRHGRSTWSWRTGSACASMRRWSCVSVPVHPALRPAHPCGRCGAPGPGEYCLLTGKVGFEFVPSHDEVCRQLLLRCTDPQAEVLEYLRRDVANLALGNKDNHARNTALQRDFQGRIALTPLYDFAPMYLHPDGIARRIRWEHNDGAQIDWSRVLDSVCEPIAGGKKPRRLDREALAAGLRAMAPVLADIARDGIAMGMEPDLHQHLKPGIERLAREMEALR